MTMNNYRLLLNNFITNMVTALMFVPTAIYMIKETTGFDISTVSIPFVGLPVIGLFIIFVLDFNSPVKTLKRFNRNSRMYLVSYLVIGVALISLAKYVYSLSFTNEHFQLYKDVSTTTIYFYMYCLIKASIAREIEQYKATKKEKSNQHNQNNVIPFNNN